MYTPSLFQESDEFRTLDLIRKNSFATLITPSGEGLQISHLPLLLEVIGDRKILVGHMAKANAHWNSMTSAPSTVIFHGPHTYITPNWYPDPLNVPTWNYASVHVQGEVKLIEDDLGLRAILDKTVRFYEGEGPGAWSTDRLPDEYIGKLSHGIVGFEIEIKNIQSKLKMSQNRNSADREGVIQGLRMRTDEMSQQVLQLMIAKD